MRTRFQLFELEDLPWFPERVRNLMTDALAALQASMAIHETMASVLREALGAADAHELVDLCSGAGGVLPRVRRALARQGFRVNVLFTDRYPNKTALAAVCRLDPEGLRFCAESVDACTVPAHLTGFRTLFTSFHHFPPEQARALLESTHRARAGIAIFEITERSLIGFVRNSLTPLACWLVTPAIRPLTFGRLFFTYLLPIVPLALTWDGFVSNLRTYTIKELTELTSTLRSDDYEWRMGKIRGSFGQVTTYLIGLRRTVSGDSQRTQRSQYSIERDNHHVSL